MTDHANDFGPFDGKIWLNSASEGPLPKNAVVALQQAVSWKVNPTKLTHQRFVQVPSRLKDCIAQLINVKAEDVVLGNSTTYGIHLLANSIPFRRGDEILLMQNDFPTDILPWLFLKEDGIVVRQLACREPVVSPEEILQAITTKTRLICLPHVHTFSGQIIDVETIGQICRERGIIFVVNISQSLGCLPVDLDHWHVDAVTTAGFKWLCGPYGTGFCWIKKELRESLKCRQAFWANMMREDELSGSGELMLRLQNSSKVFDVFGTANFFNFVPLTASIEYFLKIGIQNVKHHIDGLVEIFIKNLDHGSYFLISSEIKEKRSALIVLSHHDRTKNDVVFKKIQEQGIGIAKWKGNLRVAPHIFNNEEDIRKVLQILNQNH